MLQMGGDGEDFVLTDSPVRKFLAQFHGELALWKELNTYLTRFEVMSPQMHPQAAEAPSETQEGGDGLVDA